MRQSIQNAGYEDAMWAAAAGKGVDGRQRCTRDYGGA